MVCVLEEVFGGGKQEVLWAEEVLCNAAALQLLSTKPGLTPACQTPSPPRLLPPSPPPSPPVSPRLRSWHTPPLPPLDLCCLSALWLVWHHIVCFGLLLLFLVEIWALYTTTHSPDHALRPPEERGGTPSRSTVAQFTASLSVYFSFDLINKSVCGTNCCCCCRGDGAVWMRRRGFGSAHGKHERKRAEIESSFPSSVGLDCGLQMGLFSSRSGEPSVCWEAPARPEEQCRQMHLQKKMLTFLC